MSNQVFFAVDIETAGFSESSHGLVAIGVCVLHEGNILLQKRWVTERPPWKFFEKRCWENFWVPNKHLYEELMQSPLTSAHQAVFELSRLLDEVQVAHGPKNVLVVTDTCSFDLPWLFKLMEEAAVCPIGTVHSTGKFRDAANVWNFALGLAGRCPGKYHEKDVYEELKLPPAPVSHSHLPEQDALLIAWRMWQCCIIAEKRT